LNKWRKEKIMKKATTKNLNEYIKKTYPELEIEFWKPAEGCFVFSGPDQDENGFHVESINGIGALAHAPYEKWCEWIDYEIKAAYERAAEYLEPEIDSKIKVKNLN
jgi:hypothetical protein